VNQISGRVMRAMKWRSQVWIVALAASMLAACSSTGSPAVHGASGSPAAPTSTTAKQAAAHGESLLDYNPASSTSTVLLGPTVNGGGVIGAVPYSGRE
jgi:hypothetical protein